MRYFLLMILFINTMILQAQFGDKKVIGPTATDLHYEIPRTGIVTTLKIGNILIDPFHTSGIFIHGTVKFLDTLFLSKMFRKIGTFDTAVIYDWSCHCLKLGKLASGSSSLIDTAGLIRRTKADSLYALISHSHPEYIGLSSLSSSITGITYTNTTGIFSLTSGYVIPSTTEESTWNSLVTFPGFGTSHSTVAYGDHNHTGVYQPVGSYLTTETDPVFGASVAFDIDSGDTAAWNMNNSKVTFHGFGTTSTTAARGDRLAEKITSVSASLPLSSVTTDDTSSVISLTSTDIVNYMRTKPYYFTDMTTTQASQGFFSYSSVASGGSSTVQSVHSHPGEYMIRSSTTTNSGGYIHSSGSSLLLAGGETFTGIFNLAMITGTTLRIGFENCTTVSDATNGVYVEMAPTTGVCTGKSAKASSRTSTGTTYTVSTATWYRVSIVLNSDATRADFYIYNDAGTQLWTDYVAATMPTVFPNNCGAGLICTNVGVSSNDLINVDFLSVYLGTLTR